MTNHLSAVLGLLLFVAQGGFAASPAHEAILRLLNSRAGGSPREYADAVGQVAKDAAEGRPLQQFIIAMVSREPDAPREARISDETRDLYLEQSRDKIRALAETKSNPLAWYLLSLENNNRTMLKKAAEGDNVQALNAWGTIILTEALTNPGLEQDRMEAELTKGLECFKKAAAANDANGFYNLGMCYHRGYGAPPNPPKALECFRKAAEANHPEAINNLGGFYRDGEVVEKDLVRAARYFKKSADFLNAYGQLNYALALQRGEGVEKDPEAAAELLRDAADKGNAEAMNAYGMCLFFGDGVPKDDVAAGVWYRRSAAKGFPPAMDNLATCCDLGVGGEKKDPAKATVWKVRAQAARGDRNAIAWLSQNGHSLR